MIEVKIINNINWKENNESIIFGGGRNIPRVSLYITNGIKPTLSPFSVILYTKKINESKMKN